MSAPVLGDRSLFPSLQPRSYLAHCSISPLSAPVCAAMADFARSYAERGSAAHLGWIDQRHRLRDRLAGLVGARAGDVALVGSTTSGVVHVANSVPWRAGDRVLVFEGEFPTNVTPWRQAAGTYGLQLVRAPQSGYGDGSGHGLQRLEELLRRGLRLVAVSAVQFQTGLSMPVEAMGELCHRYGAELAVDAIQAVGVVPLTVRNVDYLVAGSHKWLMGPDGAAFVVVAPEAASRLVPRLAGWLSHEDPVGFLFGPGPADPERGFRASADVLEGGAVNGAGFAGLEAAVGLITRLGVPAIFDHVQALHDGLEAGLVARGFTSLRAVEPAARSGILAMRAPGGVDVQALVREWGARGVAVSAPEDHLRLAPHWPNARSEVEVVLDGA